MLDKNIQKDYKKENENTLKEIHKDHSKIVHDLELEERVFKTTERQAFITMKDHKPNFQNNPTCRLLNPTKPEIGRISKQILEVINTTIREKTKLKQWKNTNSAIKWYKNLENKKKLKFIQCDVESFYPSISENLLLKSINWAKQFLTITDQQIEIILQSKKNLIYKDSKPWSKKGDSLFDVAMGAFDGAETCELVGLFILKDLDTLDIDVGIYRDDVLAASSPTPRQNENIKKKICEIFRKYSLKITIDANLKSVNFLDVNFNLENESFSPFMKPNNNPIYVHTKSNHPPNILKNIPAAVNKRLCEISSNKHVFENAAPPYQEALEKSGYNHKLTYDEAKEIPTRKNRNRTRKVIWFNPPYSANVSTNIGKKFLRLIDIHFPPSHPLHQILNKNSVKISYKCTPNLAKTISSHNSKILNPKVINEAEINCNCSKNTECPVDGNCQTKNLIYQTTVNTNQPEKPETYVGLTAQTFKKRWDGHKSSIRNRNPKKSTTLSQHIWKLEDEQKDYTLDWKIVDRGHPFSPVTGICQLCTKEKYWIVYKSNLATLNSRNEIASNCRHKYGALLKQQKFG